MNSKECLNAILDLLNYEQIDECEKNNYLKTIKQDLDRLEKLEKEREEIETRLSSNETNTFDEIATMIKKANGYDVLANKCKQLEKENQKLKEDLEESFDYNALRQLKINSLEDENTKLKKAFEILKNKFEIKGVKEYLDGYVIDTKLYYIGISQEEYELLKSVLEE